MFYHIFMELKESGVLLHISSLPGKYGIGTLGENAYKFIDFLAQAGFSYWEILPITETSFSNSPYQTLSAFGLNHYFIDFDLLVKDGLLNSRDFKGIKFFDDSRKVNYKRVFDNSHKLLYKAYKRFNKNDYEFNRFKDNDLYKKYAIYMTLKEKNDFKAWYDFKLEDRYYSKEVEEDVINNYLDTYNYYYFIQFIFIKQWNKLHNYAKSKNIKIIGEISHFLDFDSASVYGYSEIFRLNKYNLMNVVAGFPPDDFSKNGQRWGEPLYDWSYMKNTHYKWWKSRINQALELFDLVKINHFSGFYQVYGIPFRSKNNKNGTFYYGPGMDIFEDLKDKPIFASDLGVYSKDVEKFVKETNYLTLKTTLLPIFKNKKIYERFYPSNLKADSLAYIGNHDNNTLKGRIEELSKNEKDEVIKKVINEAKLLNVDFNLKDLSNSYLHQKIIELLFASEAHYTTLVMQDILNQNATARMNKPGTYSNENWTYRFLNSDLSNNIIEKYKKINIKYNRINKKNFNF